MVHDELCRETNGGCAADKHVELLLFKTEKGVQAGEIKQIKQWMEKQIIEWNFHRETLKSPD